MSSVVRLKIKESIHHHALHSFKVHERKLEVFVAVTPSDSCQSVCLLTTYLPAGLTGCDAQWRRHLRVEDGARAWSERADKFCREMPSKQLNLFVQLLSHLRFISGLSVTYPAAVPWLFIIFLSGSIHVSTRDHHLIPLFINHLRAMILALIIYKFHTGYITPFF